MNTRILMASIIFASCAMPIAEYEIVDNSKSNLTDEWCAQGECIEFTDDQIIYKVDGETLVDDYRIIGQSRIESDIFGEWKEIGFSIVGDTLNLRINDGYENEYLKFYRSK